MFGTIAYQSRAIALSPLALATIVWLNVMALVRKVRLNIHFLSFYNEKKI